MQLGRDLNTAAPRTIKILIYLSGRLVNSELLFWHISASIDWGEGDNVYYVEINNILILDKRHMTEKTLITSIKQPMGNILLRLSLSLLVVGLLLYI